MTETKRKSDFYVLPTTEPEVREQFLYKLLERIRPLGHRIYIRADSESEAKAIDKRLWDYRPDAFMPHGLLAEQSESPIEIGYGDAIPEHRDVYINFALDIADLALEFDRTIEVVIQEEDILAATRANYLRYKDAGYDIRMNDMRPKG